VNIKITDQTEPPWKILSDCCMVRLCNLAWPVAVAYDAVDTTLNVWIRIDGSAIIAVGYIFTSGGFKSRIISCDYKLIAGNAYLRASEV